jgi:hypothetical protein
VRLIIHNFLFLLFICHTGYEVALAQIVSPALLDEDITLEAGLSAEEILARFGTPDRRQENARQDGASWWYGRSVIFFEKGRVTAWTAHPGELSARQQRVIQDLGFSQYHSPFAKYGWANPWQLYKLPTTDEVLQSLINDNDRTFD